MKSKYVMIAALATMMAACSNDENEVNDGRVAVQVNAEIDNVKTTRAASTTWDNNDKIGISTTSSTAMTCTNVLFYYKNEEGSKGFFTTTPIYFQDTDAVTFRAYYPYKGADALTTVGETEIISTADQTKQKDFDFMFANGATASKSEPEVNFTDEHSFHHCMSQVTFNFAPGYGVTSLSLLTDLKIEGVVNEGKFNTTTGIATAKTEGNKDITIATVSGTKASVILFPQAAPLTGNQFKISLKLDGVSYGATLTLPAAPSAANGAFTAGVNVIYTITIQKTELTVSSANITPWTEVSGGDNHKAEMTEPE